MNITHRLLSAATVKNVKPADKGYDLSDGQGLTLSVRTTGKKIWRFRHQRPNSNARTNITLGHYPAMMLAKARTLHDEYLMLLAQAPTRKSRCRTQQNKNSTPPMRCLLMWQQNGLPSRRLPVSQPFMRMTSGVYLKRTCCWLSARRR